MLNKYKVLAVAVLTAGVISQTAQAQVKNCAGETVGGAIVGGTLGAIVGGVFFNDPGVGAAIGAGTGAVGGAAHCQTSDGSVDVIIQPGYEYDDDYNERPPYDNYGVYTYNEVLAVGSYKERNFWSEQCQEVAVIECVESRRPRQRDACETIDVQLRCPRVGVISRYNPRNFYPY